MTTYSTVIATRNRPAALSLSLPLQLAQSHLPERIVVVDGSDDPSETRALVDRLAAGSPVPLVHLATEPGAARQRNLGLAHVSSDVTVFPDDDSLVHPGALAAMMRVYDLDEAGRIGGVCGTETRHPPPGVLDGEATPYEQRRSDRLKARVARVRVRLEDRLVPDPMKLAAHRLMRRLPPPEPWLAREGVERVEWMTGFRMSFRTASLRAGFNEALGRYALFEDVDAGLGVLARGQALVAARDALVYHHKSPERRSGGRELGVMHVLNRAYVTCRTGLVDARLRGALRRHARFKAFQYGLGAATAFERERLAGARAAARVIDELCDAAPDAVNATYLRLRAACARPDA